MPILQYETRISPEGYITLPPLLEYRSRKVIVSVDGDPFDDDDDDDDDGWEPDPADVRKMIEWVENSRFTVDITDEEIAQLKHERRMRKLL